VAAARCTLPSPSRPSLPRTPRARCGLPARPRAGRLASTGSGRGPTGTRLACAWPRLPRTQRRLCRTDVYYMGYLRRHGAGCHCGRLLAGLRRDARVHRGRVWRRVVPDVRLRASPVAAGRPWMGSVWPPSAPSAPRSRQRLQETHGPYNGGNGWPAINSGDGTTPNYYTPDTHAPGPPPPHGPGPQGLRVRVRPATSFSSSSPMSPTLDPADWGAHAPPLYWRSYSQDSIVGVALRQRRGCVRELLRSSATRPSLRASCC